MKQILICAAAVFLFACSNQSKTPDTNESPGAPNVQNVNGNVPDTSNSVDLSGSGKPVDSSYAKDSMRRSQ
jgi:hypothetical protein